MSKVRSIFKFAGKVFIYYALIPFIGCAIGYIILMGLLDFYIVSAFVLITYIILHKKTLVDMRDAARINIWIFTIILLVFAVLMVISKGQINGTYRDIIHGICIPFILAPFEALGGVEAVVAFALFIYALSAMTCALCVRKEIKFKRLILPVVLSAAAIAVTIAAYANRPAVRYAGHGFDYMNGYSSTDFTDYTVYAEDSKLVVPDTPPSFTIDKKDEMPVLDGAEACYPLYASFAKAVYKDIDRIERWHASSPENGKIVTFTNTIEGFERLVNGEVDMFFGARPSSDQADYAAGKSVELEITPIGKEAFVFFVEEDNPVDGLTVDEIKAIYHGDVENWSEVGGNDEEIVAFQRPENSGSQTMMEYFMGETSLKEPKKYETVGGMGGVIKEVAQYANEDGAMGYSFRYFVEELAQEKGVKLLEVDGIAPTLENIENGSYPLTVDLCLITRKDDPNPWVGKMIDFILSESGQEIVRKTGYAGLGEK